MTPHSSRSFRAALALPELWIVLSLILVFAIMRGLVPIELNGSLGWKIHPYQVFAVCVALAWFMLPGAMLVRLLQIGGNWLTRLPTYMAAAIGVWSIPSLLVASTGRFDIRFLMTIGAMMTALLAVIAYLRKLWSPLETEAALEEGQTDPDEPLNLALVVLGIAAMLILVGLSFGAPVALDDNLQVMYVQDNLVVPRINEFEPVFGAGVRPHTRGSLTTWPLNLTVIAHVSGLPAQQAFWLLRTPLVLLDLLAVYALTLRFFGKRNLAIFTALFYILLAIIYTNDADAIGFGLFARGAQDKFVVRYLLFPMTLAWSLAYLQKPNYRSYWLAGICTIGLATTHPIGVILISIPLGGLGVLHLFNNLRVPATNLLKRPSRWIRNLFQDNWSVLRPLALLSIFSLLGVIVPLLQKASPDAPIVAYSLTDTRDPTLWFRVNLALNSHRIFIADYLGPEAYIVHPSVFLEAYIILPILCLPFLWWRARKLLVSELIIGTFLLIPALLLIPPVIQFIGSRATPWLLYRFAWPLALLGPVTLAWGAWGILEWIGARIKFGSLYALIPALCLVLTAIVLKDDINRGLTVLSEQRTDSFSSRCRTLQPLFSRLPELVQEGTVVLSTPDNNLCMVSSAAYAYPVEFGLTTTINRFPESRVMEAQQRMSDVYAFAFTKVVDQAFMDILTRWNVGLILIRADHPLESQLRHMARFFKLELVEDRYMVYRVLPDSGTGVLPDLPVSDRWKVVRWTGEDALVTANTYWSQELWDEAIATYEPLVEQGGDLGILGSIGLGQAHLSAGRLEQALDTFIHATEIAPDSTLAWLSAGNAYFLQEDYRHMAKAFGHALEIVNWHPEALSRLADAFRLLGRSDEARILYERAVSSDVTPGTSVYHRTLGSTYLSINWTEEAILALKKANSIRETLLDYSLISQAYLNLGDLDSAAQAANEALRLNPWSDIPNMILGRIELEGLNSAGAIENFRKAIANNPQSTSIDLFANTLSDIRGDEFALEQIRSLVGYKLGFSEPVLATGRVQFSLGQLNEAIAFGEQAQAWKPVDSRAADFLGNVHLALGDWGQAHDFFKTALTVNPFDPAAYTGLAALAQLHGQSGTASGWGWTSRIVSPYNADATITVGTISEIKGEIDEAVNLYQLATRIGSFTPRPYVTMGNFRLGRGQFEQAIQNFSTALAVQSNATSAYRGLSSVYMGLGKLPAAMEVTDKAIALHAAEGANRVALADILVQEGNFNDAIEQLTQAIELDPGYRAAYMKLGNLYTELGMKAEAESVYMKLIQTMPLYEDGYLGLGRLYERKGKLNESLAIFRIALERVEPHVSGNISLAMADLLRRRGEFDDALEYYQTSVLQQPMLESGYIGLSAFHAQRGDLSLAGLVLEKGLSLMPTSANLNLALANLQISQGLTERAMETNQNALALSPDPNLAIQKTNLFASLGHPDQALTELEIAHQRWPGDTEVLEKGIPLLIEAGQSQKALIMAGELVTLAPGYASSWTALGNTYAAQAQFDIAEHAYRVAISTGPGDAKAWLALGQFLSSRGRIEQALEALFEAVEADRQAVAPHLAIARILLQQGKTQEALYEYQSAAEIDATDNSALLEVGRINQQQGNFVEAHRNFIRAITASPLDPDAYRAQADLFFVQGWLSAGRQSLFTAARMVVGNCRAFLNLANFLIAHGEYSAARVAYNQTLTRAGCASSARVGLGVLSMIQAASSQAIEEFAQAKISNPGDPLGYIALAEYYDQQARPDEASATYEQALSIIPSSANLKSAHSRYLIANGKLNEGLSAAQESVHLMPDASSYVALGDAYQVLGQFDKAESSYNEAILANQSISYPVLRLGSLRASLAQFAEAETAFKQALALDPTNPSGYLALADFLLSRGRTDEAILVYEQGAEADRGQIETLLSLSRYYQRAGQFNEAEEQLIRALGVSPTEDLPILDRDPFMTTFAAPPGSSRAFVVLGDLYRLKSNWEAAEQAYQIGIDLAPGFVHSYLRLGEAYQAQGRQSEAREQFEKAVETAPGAQAAHIALGNLMRIQADWTSAEHAYRSAVEVAPGHVEGYLRLGDVYTTLGRSGEAKNQFESAVAISPTSPAALVVMGNWFFSQAELRTAEQAYQRAIEMSPATPEGYIALGNLFHTRGRRGEALKQYQRALEIAPMSKLVFMVLGNWYQMEASLEFAESWYQKAIKVDAADINGHLSLGYIYLAQDEPNGALTQIQTAFSLAPGDARSLVALGDWYRANLNLEETEKAAKEELDKALELLTKAEVHDLLAEEPDEFIEYLIVGMEYQNDGQVVEAYEQFEAAIAADPDSVLPYLAMGQYYQIIAGLPSAEQAYQSAITLAPGETSGYLHLGLLYQSTGRPAEAVEQFEKAVETTPGLAVPLIVLGDGYKAEGRWAEAEQSYLRAIDIAPGDVRPYLKLGETYQAQGKRVEGLAQFEMAVKAGLAAEASICGPGWLPSVPGGLGDTESVPSNGLLVGAWRCQWENRPWSVADEDNSS